MVWQLFPDSPGAVIVERGPEGVSQDGSLEQQSSRLKRVPRTCRTHRLLSSTKWKQKPVRRVIAKGHIMTQASSQFPNGPNERGS